MERFKDDTTTHFRNGPWWHPFYQYSYSFRLLISLMDYPDYFLSSEQIAIEEKECLEAMSIVYKEAMDIANSKGAKLLVVIHPDPNHIEQVEVIDGDIIPLSNNLEEKDIPYVDIHQCMRTSFKGMDLEEYSWPINGHFNELGYGVMSDCIYEQILVRDQSFFD